MKRSLIQPVGLVSVFSSSRQHQVNTGIPLRLARSMTSVKVPSGFCQVDEATMYSGTVMPQWLSCSMA